MKAIQQQHTCTTSSRCRSAGSVALTARRLPHVPRRTSTHICAALVQDFGRAPDSRPINNPVELLSHLRATISKALLPSEDASRRQEELLFESLYFNKDSYDNQMKDMYQSHLATRMATGGDH